MSVLDRVSSGLLTRNRLRRFLVPFAVVVVAALVATGLRTGANMWETYQLQRASAPAHAAMPTNAQIEQTWGVRMTLVQLMADHGLVEMRYLVVDSVKAARLHADPTSLNDIPWFKVEGSGKLIKSQSVMFHFQHGVGNGLEGHTYSIIYGNAGNAVHPHSFVTIVMPDNLELKHVPVDG
jgi:hypothetical protein